MIARDTIVACATPTGYSGLAVIRLSGPDAVFIATHFFLFADASKSVESNHAYYGRIIDPRDPEKRVIDWSLATFFITPHSYTGEDAVEVSCHGNPLIVDRIISIAVSQGARPAEPGEFTRRALLNGKLDLIQAEAVLDMVHAPCDDARRLAIVQYEGVLSQRVREWRSVVTDLLIMVEAHIDFPDEEDVVYEQKQVNFQVQKLLTEIDVLLTSAKTGVKIKEGYRVAIAGRVNVGKSTLFNKLLGYERAIVHQTPGTTRDYIEEGVEIRGLFLRLTDTAGVMNVVDMPDVDKLGIDRTLQVLDQADLVLMVFDGSEPLNEHDIQLYNLVKDRSKIMVINKIDLNIKLREGDILTDSVKLSAKTGDNLDQLRDAIRKHLSADRNAGPGLRKDLMLTRHRHIRALKEVKKCLLGVIENNTPDTVAFELHSALEIIGELTGQRIMRKEILDKIFEEFCIGK
ncbi:MAG TPA: tRNA uridine-5-carboxymethylaminomethyl(34) synthesis GTPase MnmE [bacterium]